MYRVSSFNVGFKKTRVYIGIYNLRFVIKQENGEDYVESPDPADSDSEQNSEAES